MSGQDFTVAPTSGTTLRAWADPARPAGTLYPTDPGAPSRLNPHPGIPHKMVVAQVGVEVEIEATVSGAVAPLDAALGGRLFRAWAVEHPQPGPVPFTHPVGQTSSQHFTPSTEGHYCIGLAREGGGSVLMHIDAEVP